MGRFLESSNQTLCQWVKTVGKAALWKVPADHFRTLYNYRTKRPDWRGIGAQVLLPVMVGGVTWYFGAKIADVNAAVSGISIVSGLLFTMVVFLFQLRTTLPSDKRLVKDDFTLIDECMANTLWAIVWGLALAVYLIVCGAGRWIGENPWGPLLTGVAIAGTIHFLLVIGMCLKRLRRAYKRIAMKQP